MTLDALLDCGTITRISHATYPDTTPVFSHIPPIKRLLIRQDSFAEFCAAMLLLDAMRYRGIPIPELIIPMFPGQRQDRINQTGDSLFTARSLAEMVNSRQAPSVTILDPHSDVTPALLDRCRVIDAYQCIKSPRGKYAAVVAPDAGADKRAGKVANSLGVPLLHAWKTRDVTTGALSGFGIQEHNLPPGSLVLVVDDICDAGGTFVGLANVINNSGIVAHLWTTHGLFTRGTAQLLQSYSHVYCSDSVNTERKNIIVIDICDKLLKDNEL